MRRCKRGEWKNNGHSKAWSSQMSVSIPLSLIFCLFRFFHFCFVLMALHCCNYLGRNGIAFIVYFIREIKTPVAPAQFVIFEIELVWNGEFSSVLFVICFRCNWTDYADFYVEKSSRFLRLIFILQVHKPRREYIENSTLTGIQHIGAHS